MNIVLDLIILAIVIVTIYLSTKKGFVKVLVETVGFILAIVIAFTVSTPLAEATYDKFIEPSIIQSAEKTIQNDEGIEKEVWENIPDFITKNAENFGISEDSFSQTINENISLGTKKAVTVASQNVIKPVCVSLVSMIYGVILTTVLFIVVKFAAKFLNKLFSFSLVGKLNRILGGVLGVFKGVAFAVLFVVIVSFLVSINGKLFNITIQDIEKTFLFKEILINFNV